MPLSRDDVLAVARLARLDLSDAEVEALEHDLQKILAHVDELGELDTRDVPPTHGAAVIRAPLREDQPSASLSHEQALREAPRTSDGAFAVPGFVDES